MIQFKHLTILLAALVLIIQACNTDSQIADSATTFSASDTELISSANNKAPMRVFLTTDKKDSLILRSTSDKFVNYKNSPLVDTLIARMLTTVTDSASMGVGIAAPQVGILKRVILVQRFDKENEPFEAYINPSIIQFSSKKQDCREGCLSIPQLSGTTTDRSYAILVEHYNTDGEKTVEMVEDFTAVIFQHEIDHLNGKLFIDHL